LSAIREHESQTIRQDEEDLIETKSGTVLRSIEWCPTLSGLKAFRQYLCLTLSQLRGTASLPYRLWLKRDTNPVFARKQERSKLKMSGIWRRENEEVEQVYDNHQRQLAESVEAATVCQLRTLLANAQVKLTDHAEKCRQQERRYLAPRANWIRSFEDHRSLLEYCSRASSTDVDPLRCAFPCDVERRTIRTTCPAASDAIFQCAPRPTVLNLRMQRQQHVFHVTLHIR